MEVEQEEVVCRANRRFTCLLSRQEAIGDGNSEQG